MINIVDLEVCARIGVTFSPSVKYIVYQWIYEMRHEPSERHVSIYHTFVVGYRKSDFLRPKATQAPSNNLRGLYRVDGLLNVRCLGHRRPSTV